MNEVHENLQEQKTKNKIDFVMMENERITQSTNIASSATIVKQRDNTLKIVWTKENNNPRNIPHPNFVKDVYDIYQKDEIVFCTEYVRGNIRYCCHPNYHSIGQYYDWMLVLHDDGRNFPCKLIACIPGEKMDLMDII